ncbi:unnamed protein product [Symbiodinium natans]|uniref:Uncharacterized protein n=1 Tax=Symbiodinium natans TaxID=878477 RepID=A0A812N4W5_9DINO|nr:unnamed protein product [Symbiodinium natans]
MQHPDPWRSQLDNIVDAYRPKQLDSLVWIFLDYVSLHQYRRDPDQESLFRRTLRDMHILYAHEAIEVHRIEELTPQRVRDGCMPSPFLGVLNPCWGLLGRRLPWAFRSRIPVYWEAEQTVMDVPIWELKLNFTPYAARGWCQAERQWAALRASLKGASVPLPPEMFRSQMRQLKFTHQDDSETVFELQKKVFHQKASSTANLLVQDLDGEGLAVLLAALPFYHKLQELAVNAVPEHAWKLALAVVESGARELRVECECLQDEDAVALAADLSKEGCAHLERLHLKCATIGELGSHALQQMSVHLGASLDLALTVPGQEAEPGQPRTALRILVSKRKQPQRPDPPMQVPAQSGHADSPSFGGEVSFSLPKLLIHQWPLQLLLIFNFSARSLPEKSDDK